MGTDAMATYFFGNAPILSVRGDAIIIRNFSISVFMRSKKTFSIKMDQVIRVICNPDLCFPRYICRIFAERCPIRKGGHIYPAYCAG